MSLDALLEWMEPMLPNAGTLVGPYTIRYTAPACKFVLDPSYAGSSRSTCGLACLNCVRLAFRDSEGGVSDMEYVKLMISDEKISAVTRFSADLKSSTLARLEFDELLRVPLFQKTLVRSAVLKGASTVEGLKETLLQWFPFALEEKILALIIQVAPEIIICFRVLVDESFIYIIFDPHSRPDHLDGPAYVLINNVDATASYLQQLFEHRALDSPSQALIPEFSAHLLKSRQGSDQWEDADLLSESVAYLEITFPGPERETLKARDAELTVLDHVALLRTRAEALRKEQIKDVLPDTPDSHSSTVPKTPMNSVRKRENVIASEATRRSEFGWQLSLLMDPIEGPDAQDDVGETGVKVNAEEEGGHTQPPLIDLETEIPPVPPLPKEVLKPQAQSEFSWLTNFMQAPAPSSQMRPDQGDAKGDSLPELPIEEESVEIPRPGLTHMQSQSEFGWQLALQLDTSSSVTRPPEPEYWLPSGAAKPKKRKTPLTPEEKRKRKAEDDLLAAELTKTWEVELQEQLQAEEDVTVSGNASGDQAWLVTLRKQLKDEQRNKLQQESAQGSLRGPRTGDTSIQDTEGFPAVRLPHLPPTFECGICGDWHGAAESIKMRPCQHSFCKPCATTLIQTKLDENKYPITCPVCYVERSRTTKGHVTQEILDALELPTTQLDKLISLQLLPHSILLNCPRCKQSMNVDREQYTSQGVLQCPLPSCAHKWCKTCLKDIASSEDNHKCKNNGFDRLMRRKGWRYCPGCHTPVQKESGCNHMTCGSPGCNVHFCYKCGVLIIDTTDGGDLGTAVTDHYAVCKLFDRTFKCTIQ